MDHGNDAEDAVPVTVEIVTDSVSSFFRSNLELPLEFFEVLRGESAPLGQVFTNSASSCVL